MHSESRVRWNASMRLRLVAAALLVEVFMLGLLLANSFRLLTDALETQTHARIEALAPLLNASLSGRVFQRDHAEIEAILQQLVRSQLTDIRYLAVFDRRGEPMAQAGSVDSRRPPATDRSVREALSDLCYDTVVPLTLVGNDVGSVRLGLSVASMVSARDSVTRQGLLIAAGEVVLSLLLLASGGYLITRHLTELIAATRRITRGDYGSRIKIERHDEIGLLASNFNAMSQAVEDRIRALERSEASLRESETRFREIFDTVREAIFIHDPATGDILDVNRGMCEMYGYTREEAMRSSLVALSAGYPPYSLADAQRLLAKAIEEGPQTFEWLARARDGRVFWVEVSLRLALLGSNRRVLAVVRDIGERKRSEEHLRLAASVFEHASEGILITDAEGRILNVNQAFVEITGYSRDEAVGWNPRFLRSGRHDSEFYAAMWRSLTDTGYWRGELWNRKKSGELFAELLTISAIRGPDGAITQYVGLFSDITQIKEHQHELEYMAHYDALTRLPNRVLLGDRLRLAIAQCQRAETLLAIGYMDLDGFKPVNDSLGHETGDILLTQVARRLKECVRGGDTVCRLGGDEFVLIVSDLHSVDECAAAFSRILSVLSAPYSIGDHLLVISASIGVSLYPLDDADPDTLLRHADQAMYAAKQAGRGRFHLFDPSHDQQAKARHEALARIEEALLRREFVLHYQPKVNMRTGVVAGVEALVRWQHPERGLLAPAEFLPMIEETPLAEALGEWVLESAVAQLERWRADGLDIGVSVNISARHLQAQTFAGRLGELLARHPGLSPHALELEILETAALDDMNLVSAVIDECHRFGVRFALDDFGTGYSSLSYLKRLQVDTLKIDQTFVRDLLDDPEDRAIVESIIGLTRAFRRHVVAEGVESAEVGEALLRMGCEFAQGFGIARPMTAGQVPGWVAAYRPHPAWLQLA